MDAVQTMAYAGAVPWHGKGENVDPRASVETWLQRSGLDWSVETSPVSYRFAGRKQKTSQHFRMLIRSDTGQEFDVVGPRYEPVQNAEVLEFFREYVEAGEMSIETCGALNEGRDIWALAKMDEAFTLPGKDQVGGYVLLMNPHRYGKGMVLKFTGMRVVCWNTLQVALKDGAEAVKLWHNMRFDGARRDEAKRRLGLARDEMAAFEKDARTLVALELKPTDAVRVAAEVFGGDPTATREEQPRRTRRVLDLYHGQGIGAGLSSAEGTGWGLLNAVTQYIDHEYGRSQDARLEYAWLGAGETVKRKARVKLLELAA